MQMFYWFTIKSSKKSMEAEREKHHSLLWNNAIVLRPKLDSAGIAG